MNKVQYSVKLSVPCNSIDEKNRIDEIAIKAAGTTDYDSGFGMGYRDLDFYFPTLPEAVSIGRRVRKAFQRARFTNKKKAIIFVRMQDIDL